MHVLLAKSQKDITSFGTVVDITKQYKSLFENSPDAILAVDCTGIGGLFFYRHFAKKMWLFKFSKNYLDNSLISMDNQIKLEIGK
jgi:hypothetical protein